MRKLLLAMVLSLPLATIGNTTEEVEFDFYPDSPIVFENDTIDGGGDDARRIYGPWYLGGFSIVNNHSNYVLYVVNYKITYSGTLNGQPFTTEKNLTMRDFCNGYDSPVRRHMAIVQPNSVFYGDANCDGVNDGQKDQELIYFQQLPGNDSTVYDVSLTLEGFYFDESDPTDPIKERVQKTVNFVTQ